MKRHPSLKVKEKNGSASYVSLAIVMVIVIGLYTILPPLMSSKNSGYRPTFQTSDVSHNTSGFSQLQSSEYENGDSKGNLEKGNGDPLMVYTQYGPIKGTHKAGVRIFHGVRFAKPPLKDLRWKAPQIVESWGPSVYDATWVRPGCPQILQTFFYPANGTSEDCLYLEIFAPFVNESNMEEGGLPVLIYIHGGGFRDMSATTPVFDSAYLAARGNMIVVLPEYRIGSLGFLFTGTSPDQVVGNFGIMDQTLAIEWIKGNIKAFGGDPKKITLAGHSAGAQCVVHHLTTPETARHFRHVMLSSIPLTNPYRSTTKAISRSHMLATQLGCFTEQQKEPDLVCLRNKSMEDIRNAEDFLADNPSPVLGALLDRVNPWGPVIDGKLLKFAPLDAMLKFADEISSNRSKIKPMVMGLTTEEAYFFVKQVSNYKSMGKFYLAIMSSVTDANLSELVALYPVTNGNDILRDMAAPLTDFLFRCPMRVVQRRLASSLSKGRNNSSPKDMVKFWTYLWHPPMVGDLPLELEFCRGKSCHGAELPFLFHSSDNSTSQPNSRQMKLSNAFIDYVANFVATGDPNIAPGESFQTVDEKEDRSSSKGNNIQLERQVTPLHDKNKILQKRCTDKCSQSNDHTMKRREVEMSSKILKILFTGSSYKSSEDSPVELWVRDVEKRIQRRSIAKGHPYWEPVTTVSGFSKTPTWLCNELNFMKNSKIQMLKRAEIKGRQCDMWDETGYKFPKLFGSQ